MAKFDKIAVLNKIGSTGMVPVFYHKDAEVAKKVVKACYDGGVRAFEFTNRVTSHRKYLLKSLSSQQKNVLKWQSVAEERVDPFAVIRTFGKVPFECQRTFPRKEKVHLEIGRAHV